MAALFVVLDLEEPLEYFEVFEISLEESDAVPEDFSLDLFSTDDCFDDGSLVDEEFLRL